MARSFSLVPVAEALVAADARGVRVQVLADGDVSRDYRAIAVLSDALGSDRGADSFVRLTRGSARGGATELHQKSWSFSRTGSSRHVVMVGSMNLSSYSTRQYTDMYAFVGRANVWRAFNDVFRDQVRDRPLEDPAVSVRLGRDHAWFFPGYDLDTDPMRAVLEDLPQRDLRVQVAMYAWVDERGRGLAEILADKARAGADVEVVAGKTMGTLVRDELESADVPIRVGVFATPPDDGDDIHLKLVLASWTGDDGRTHRLISTGSDNFGSRSLDRDEVVVAIDAGARDLARYRRFLGAIAERADREGTGPG